MADSEGSLPGRSQFGAKRHRGRVRERNPPPVGGGPPPGIFFKELMQMVHSEPFFLVEFVLIPPPPPIVSFAFKKSDIRDAGEIFTSAVEDHIITQVNALS